jgi:hypothetical protein
MVEQWDKLVEVLAQLATHYGIPITQNTILTHAEVQTNLGVKQNPKWDITVCPLYGHIQKGTAKEVGDLLRKEIVDARFTAAPAIAEPTESAAGWIVDPGGSRFWVNAGWRWEEAEQKEVKQPEVTNTYPLPAGYDI